MITLPLRTLRTLAGLILLVSGINSHFSPAYALSAPVFPPSAHFLWNASPDAHVVGYNLYYGTQSNALSSHLALGNVTSASVSGTIGQRMYFLVKGRDSAGNESPPSDEIGVTMQAGSTPAETVGAALSVATVTLQIASTSGGVQISAANPIAALWVLESSADMTTWQTISTGSNSMVNVTLPATAEPAVFYRLRGP